MLRALLLFLALLSAGRAAGEEVIERFDSDVRILEDGTLEVTERIEVRAEGREIRRGIYRDFPVEYREDDGRVSRASFEVITVTRNGAAEPYRVEQDGPIRRVRIGQADVFLPVPSAQRYRITYRTGGHLRSLDDRDELFWNVTGNDWSLPIKATSVTFRLPRRIAVTAHAGYTGRRGETGRDWRLLEQAPGYLRAEASRRLEPGEGLSVAVAWKKGAIDVPPVDYVAGRPQALMINGNRTTGPAAVLATFLGFLIMGGLWVAVGRDPEAGAIHPRFEPPAGLSPAAARFVRSLGLNQRCLPAAILSMAVKGAVVIREAPGDGPFGWGRRYSLVPQGTDGRGLSPGERSAYARLFPGGETLTLKSDETNGKRVDAARAALLARLRDEHYRVTIMPNLRYTLLGAGVAAALGALMVGYAEGMQPLMSLLWLGAAALAGTFGHAGLSFAARLRDGGGLGATRLASPGVLALVAAFAASETIVPVLAVSRIEAVETPLTVAAAGAVLGLVVALFHLLMAAPTKAGRALLDHLEGFALYLRTAEEDRLDVLNPPDRTPELFERLLPYAAALGLTHQWSARFADVLGGTAAPKWVEGHTGEFDIGGFDRDFGGAVASTSVPSRDGGGSGGSGGSGGGGGGGGGGGW